MNKDALRARVLNARMRGPQFSPCVSSDELQELLDHRDALLAALQVFVCKYDAAPDGELGIGLVNGDFTTARAAIAKATGEEACRNALTECTPMSQRRASRIMDARSAKATAVQP